MIGQLLFESEGSGISAPAPVRVIGNTAALPEITSIIPNRSAQDIVDAAADVFNDETLDENARQEALMEAMFGTGDEQQRRRELRSKISNISVYIDVGVDYSISTEKVMVSGSPFLYHFTKYGGFACIALSIILILAVKRYGKIVSN